MHRFHWLIIMVLLGGVGCERDRTTMPEHDAATPTTRSTSPHTTTIETRDPHDVIGPLRTEQDAYYHEVRAGETLAKLAQKYKVTVETLIEANGLSDPNLLRPGQLLYIPDKTPPTQQTSKP